MCPGFPNLTALNSRPGETPPWDKQDHLVGPLLPGGADSGPEKLIGVFDIAEFRQPVGGDLVGERECGHQEVEGTAASENKCFA